MLTADQIVALGAVLSPIVVGIVALLGFRHEGRERERDRRQTFQRDAIIELQESIWQLREVAVEMVSVARSNFVEVDLRKKQKMRAIDRGELFLKAWQDYYDKDLETKFQQAHVRTIICESRVGSTKLVDSSADVRKESAFVYAYARDTINSLMHDDELVVIFSLLDKHVDKYFNLHTPFNLAAREALEPFVARKSASRRGFETLWKRSE